MKVKKSLVLHVVCVLSLLFVSFIGVSVAPPTSPYIKVSPESIMPAQPTIDTTFKVSIYTDYTGSDICSWQFELTFNPEVLEGILVENGDLITTAKSTTARYSTRGFNNTEGRLKLTLAYFYYSYPSAPYTTSGPGILANVTFRVKDYGISNITLDDVIPNESRLRGWDAVLEETYDIVNAYDYPDNIAHGYFNNLADTNDDEEVNVLDVYALGKAYGSTSGHPNCDFDGDNDVDAVDLAYLSASYGKTG